MTFASELAQSLEGLLQSSGVLSSSDLTLVVGLSGGVDSIVLLHLLHSLSSSNSLSTSPSAIPPTSPSISQTPHQNISKPCFNFKLKAIHVNHQLQSQANDWQSFCISFCEKFHIPLQCVSVDATPKQGEGPEAAARNARYAVFKKHIYQGDVLLTGHHLDDQIETVFLQMLRGTGVDGAAGIRAISSFDAHSSSTYLIRPLLMFAREKIEAYANENNLQWIDDPSNAQTHYDRNFLRREVLPVIEKRWPSYRQTVSRFSKHMREASELLKEIANIDFESVSSQKKGLDKGLKNDVESRLKKRSLSIIELKKLSAPRINYLLRFWIEFEGYSTPSDRQLDQINAAITAREDACPVVHWGEVELRRFKNDLYLMPVGGESPTETFYKNQTINVKNWKQGEKIAVPGYGEIELRSSKGDGIRLSCFSSQNIQIKFRQGGEKCKPLGRDKTQTLKKVFQEKNIPPWLRDSTPIVYIDNEIAAVVGEFYCLPFATEKNAVDEEVFTIVRVVD